jgi:hypothetical protein
VDEVSLPNFFIVGAAKAGTTSLVRYLGQHPDVFFPNLKEPKYFSHQDNLFPHNGPGDKMVDAKVIIDFDRYAALFAPGKGCPARGEASVDYLFFKGTPSRIRKCLNDTIIFIILREPTERAFSAYMHMVRDGRENLTFEEAIEAEPERINRNWEFFWRYTEVGFYSTQVQRYRDVFGKDQVFIFLYEDLLADAIGLCKTVFKILQVDSRFKPDVLERHNISGRPRIEIIHRLFNRQNMIKSAFKPFFPRVVRKYVQQRLAAINLGRETMEEATRRKLRSAYRADIVKLQRILDRDLGHWIAGKG